MSKIDFTLMEIRINNHIDEIKMKYETYLAELNDSKCVQEKEKITKKITEIMLKFNNAVDYLYQIQIKNVVSNYNLEI